MSNLTEHSLGVIWWVEKEDSNARLTGSHEEVDGVTLYGYWKDKPAKEPSFPNKLWPKGTLMKSHHLYNIEGDNWFVLLWDIRIFEWPKPDEWEGVLKKTLMCMLDAGAKVAWCGLEGNFVDPPSLFDPAEMPPSGVYAALSKKFGFKCTAKLGLPYQGFSDDDFHQLKTLLM